MIRWRMMIGMMNEMRANLYTTLSLSYHMPMTAEIDILSATRHDIVLAVCKALLHIRAISVGYERGDTRSGSSATRMQGICT